MSESTAEHEAILLVLRGAPNWIAAEAVRDSLKTFRPYYGEPMTPEDALGIHLRRVRVFVLRERGHELCHERPRAAGAERSHQREPRCEFVARFLVDVDRSAKNVFVRNHPRVPYVVSDIHQLSGDEIKAKAGRRPDERLDVLIGRPPCQGFSFLGKRALEDERNIHVLDYLRLVKELRPLVAVMENVPLVITSHDGAVIKAVCAALSDFGYA